MQLEPAAVDRELEAPAVFGRAAAVAEEKRLVDFLDVDARPQPKRSQHSRGLHEVKPDLARGRHGHSPKG